MGLVRPQVACRREEPNAIYLHFYRGHVGVGWDVFSCHDQRAWDYTTIQAAVDAASDGDVILVAPGTYTDTIRTATSLT